MPRPLFVGLGREERTTVGERSETGEGRGVARPSPVSLRASTSPASAGEVYVCGGEGALAAHLAPQRVH